MLVAWVGTFDCAFVIERYFAFLLFSTYSYRLGWEIVNSIRMNTDNVVLALVVSFLPCRVSSSQLLGHRIRSTPSCFIIQTGVVSNGLDLFMDIVVLDICQPRKHLFIIQPLYNTA